MATRIQTKEPRDNTAVVDFASCVPRPAIRDIEKLLKSEMKLYIPDLHCIQMHHTRNCVLIMFRELSSAERFVSEHNLKHFIASGQSNYQIPVYLEDNAVDVRVHDLPLAIASKVIERKMREYGEVLSVNYDRWKNFFPGLYNGVRIVRMRIKKPIPSYLVFSTGTFSEQSMVSHKNQRTTCQWCDMFSHQGQTCADAAKKTTIETPTTNAKTTPAPATKTSAPPAETSIIETQPLPQQPAIQSSSAVNKSHNIEHKKSENHTRRNSVGNENDNSTDFESTDPQPGGSDAPVDVTSPPRKKITARGGNKK